MEMNLTREAALPNTPMLRREATESAPPVTPCATEREAHKQPLDPEEAQWVDRARQGDLVAFDWLMTRYRERAVRLAAHVLRRPAEAEDLVQESFLRAFAQIREFRVEAGFYTWLYKIVVRCCLNRLRTPAWTRERELDAQADEWVSTLDIPGPEKTDTRLLVEALLDQLSPPLRAALSLREFEGLDYNEIGEMLQIPIGTVRSRLNAARQQFRVLWQNAMEEV